MNLTVNADASYSYQLDPEDVQAIKEDIDDVLRAFNGHGVVVEVTVHD